MHSTTSVYIREVQMQTTGQKAHLKTKLAICRLRIGKIIRMVLWIRTVDNPVTAHYRRQIIDESRLSSFMLFQS
jgi:hypothetical protein